ncbi:MAG: hypothetical protein M9962_04940 [Oligoflexia bacterium]|nr:hypothetical protein [Oligoflexia bacterium]
MIKINFKFLIIITLLVSGTAFSEEKTINGITYSQDQAGKYQTVGEKNPISLPSFNLKKIFLFPSADQVNGVLGSQLDKKLEQLFRRDSRFDIVIDREIIRALNPSNSAYGRAVLEPAVHGEAIKVANADASALLRVSYQGAKSELILEIRDKLGDLLFQEKGDLPTYSTLDSREGLLIKLFDSFVSKIPFSGTITGRTGADLILDLGSGQVKNSDELDVIRILSVQRHPLLKVVVGTDFLRLGRVKVTKVDRTISFAKILEETPGERVQPGDKLLISTQKWGRISLDQEMPTTNNTQRSAMGGEQLVFKDEKLEGDFDKPKARYGVIGLGLGYGSLSHSQTINATNQEFSGSGIGGSIDGELWITKNWILKLDLAILNSSLSNSTGTKLGDASFKKFSGAGGYRFFPDSLMSGLSITGLLGYRSISFQYPVITAQSLEPQKFTGIFFGMGADVGFTQGHSFLVGIQIMPFASLAQGQGLLGTTDGGTNISFQAGWRYEFIPNLKAGVGIEFDSASGNYTNNNVVNEKHFRIGPNISYAF